MIYRVAVCDDRQTDRDFLASLLNEWAEDVGHVVQTRLFPSVEIFQSQACSRTEAHRSRPS